MQKQILQFEIWKSSRSNIDATQNMYLYMKLKEMKNKMDELDKQRIEQIQAIKNLEVQKVTSSLPYYLIKIKEKEILERMRMEVEISDFASNLDYLEENSDEKPISHMLKLLGKNILLTFFSLSGIDIDDAAPKKKLTRIESKPSQNYVQRIHTVMHTDPNALFDELDAFVVGIPPVWDAKASSTEKASVTVGSSRNKEETANWQRERAGSDQIFAEFLADL
jgi:hypothetical protein